MLATRRHRPTPPPVWTVTAALSLADDILSKPPARPWIARVPPRGECVARFVLPLDVCQPQNRTRHAIAWKHAKRKAALRKLMAIQHYAQGNGHRREPLPGRPLIRCVRFSSVEPDKYADWAKSAIDALTVKHGGIGYLRDDRPRDVEVCQWWEPGPSGNGTALVEVWTG